MAIPAALIYFARRRKDLPFRGVFWLFGAFIVSCGVTHLLDAVSIYHPFYRLTGVAKLVTALVSWYTAVRVAPLIPQMLALRSPRELELALAERERAEAVLRESEARFRTLVESAPDAIIVSDAAGRITGWNAGAQTRFGYTAAEAVGRPMALIIPPRFREAHERGMARLQATGEARVLGKTVELVGLRRDGTEFPLELALARWTTEANGDCYCGILRDISERKRQEVALAEAEARYRSMFENATEGIFQTTPEGTYLSANPALADIYGYASPDALRAGVTDIARRLYVDPGRRAEFVALLECDGRVQNFESRVRRADGSVLWIKENARLVRDAAGAVLYYEGTVSDVTRRKQAEEALHATDRRLRGQNRVLTDLTCRRPADAKDDEAFVRELTAVVAGCLDVARASVWLFDAGRRLRCVDVYDRRADAHDAGAEIQADAFPAYLAAVEEDRVIAAADALADPRTVAFGDSHLRPLGITALLDAPIRLGGRTVGVLCCEHVGGTRRWEADEAQFAASVADVAALALEVRERRRADERVREQAALLDQATDAIFVVGPDDRLAYWNRSAERLYGWAAAEVLGCDPADLLYDPPAADLQAAHRAVDADGAWSGELRQRDRAGNALTVESRWTLVRDPAGRVKARLVVNTDVTEKKRLEAQALRAQRMESLGTLAGGIAHDLNNVLTPIVMAAQLVRQRATDETSRSFLTTLEENALRGADMVRQILSFARGAEGMRQPLMLQAVVTDLNKMLGRTLPKAITIDTVLPPDLWLVLGDSTQLYQVLMNLCVNARDAMPRGGRLTVEARNRVVDAAYTRLHLDARPGQYVQVAVTDTGVGMPPAVKERIFEPFFTTKAVGHGTGLGLSTVLGIVKSHGGFIHVYSEPGRGTTFTVFLPAADAGTAGDAAGGDAAGPRGNGRVVLLVDDEAAIRQIACGTLEAFGYRVLVAKDGAEALGLYREHAHEIDVVLTDMMMPGMDGPATIRALRELEPRLRIIAASGLNAHAHEAKVEAFLPKPYTADALLRTLHDVCAAGRN